MRNFRFNATAPVEQRAPSPVTRCELDLLVDAMLDGYVSWREACVRVEAAYEAWSHAERRDKALAFAAYLAALDREQVAATSYRRFAGQVAKACEAAAPAQRPDRQSAPADIKVVASSGPWALRGRSCTGRAVSAIGRLLEPRGRRRQRSMRS